MLCPRNAVDPDLASQAPTAGLTSYVPGLSTWCCVKSDHYDTNTDRGRISLAEAVSRFANAEEGGIVVVGMDTKRIPGGELIKSIKPVPIDTSTARRYRQVIESRIFPFPMGLAIRTVETALGCGLLVVSIPPQEEELKPFLVHGAIVNGRIEGAFILHQHCSAQW